MDSNPAPTYPHPYHSGSEPDTWFKESAEELLYRKPQTAATPREGWDKGWDCLTAKEGEIQQDS